MTRRSVHAGFLVGQRRGLVERSSRPPGPRRWSLELANGHQRRETKGPSPRRTDFLRGRTFRVPPGRDGLCHRASKWPIGPTSALCHRDGGIREPRRKVTGRPRPLRKSDCRVRSWILRFPACPPISGCGRQASMLLQEPVSLHLVGEEEDHPGVVGARSEHRLAPVVPVLKEVVAVLM